MIFLVTTMQVFNRLNYSVGKDLIYKLSSKRLSNNIYIIRASSIVGNYETFAWTYDLQSVVVRGTVCLLNLENSSFDNAVKDMFGSIDDFNRLNLTNVWEDIEISTGITKDNFTVMIVEQPKFSKQFFPTCIETIVSHSNKPVLETLEKIVKHETISDNCLAKDDFERTGAERELLDDSESYSESYADTDSEKIRELESRIEKLEKQFAENASYFKNSLKVREETIEHLQDNFEIHDETIKNQQDAISKLRLEIGCNKTTVSEHGAKILQLSKKLLGESPSTNDTLKIDINLTDLKHQVSEICSDVKCLKQKLKSLKDNQTSLLSIIKEAIDKQQEISDNIFDEF